MGDVLTGGTVATGRRSHQFTVPVQQVDGESVDLQLGQPFDGAAWADRFDARGSPAHPDVQLGQGEDVLQAVHALQVVDGGEGRGGIAADFLGGRIVGDQLRMQCLDSFQPPEQLIELRVGNCRRVLVVVGEPVPAHLLRQGVVFLTQGIDRRLVRGKLYA